MADAVGIVVPHRNQQTLVLVEQLNPVVEGLPLTPAHDAQSYKPCLEPAVGHSQERQKLRQCVDANILVNGFDESVLASTF